MFIGFGGGVLIQEDLIGQNTGMGHALGFGIAVFVIVEQLSGLDIAWIVGKIAHHIMVAVSADIAIELDHIEIFFNLGDVLKGTPLRIGYHRRCAVRQG